MKRIAIIFFSQLLISFTVSAQFFSGYFVSDPSVDEFEHLKIHHHHSKHHKYEGNLSVKGFSDFGELWDMSAQMITGEKADLFIKEFADGEQIQTVYELKIAFDGIEEDFILMGYVNTDGHPEFIAVEEIFSSSLEENLLEVKSFRLVKAHHLHE